MDNSVIAKSGWMYKQTAILKKWKKNWVELYRDGHLKYYENECSPNAEDIIFMPTECISVKVGLQVDSVQPPDGYGVQNLLSVSTSSGKTWVFCGESLDDMRAWQLALEQARLIGLSTQVPGQIPSFLPYNPAYLPSYPGDSALYMPPYAYPPPAYYGYPGPQFLAASTQPGLVYHPERYYRPDGGDLPLGMMNGSAAAAAAAAAAPGPLMWGPLLWW